MIRKISCVFMALVCLVSASWMACQRIAAHPECQQESYGPNPEPSAEIDPLKSFSGIQLCLSDQLDYSDLTYSTSSDHLATAWPLSQLIEGTLSVAMMPESKSKKSVEKLLQQELDALDQYWDTTEQPPGYRPLAGLGSGKGHRFYDDNAWIALALIHCYKYNHDEALLEQAKRVFRFLESGTDGTENLPRPGGIYWTQDPDEHYRSTVSTAGSAEVALHLYLLTGLPEYLHFAEQTYAWLNSVMRASDGLYMDGIKTDEYVEPAKFTYNQGLMIGVNTLLFQATRDKKFLTEAQAIASASLREFGTDEKIWSQPPGFNAIYFKNMMLLHSVAPDDSYVSAMADYGSQLWQHTNQTAGIFFYEGQNLLIDQSASMQVLAYLELPPEVIN